MTRPSATLRGVRVVLRGWGYEVRHAANVPSWRLEPAEAFGVAFQAVRRPVVALCGTRIRSANEAIVVMEGHEPTCKTCLVLVAESGSEVTP